MAVSGSMTHDTITIGEPIPSPEPGARGFVAVNHGSSDESDESSRLSSPQEHTQRGREVSSHTSSSALYPSTNSHDENGHKRKRSGSEDASKPDDQRQYQYSPSQRPEAQHMANRALRVLGNTEQNGTGYHVNPPTADTNGHNWSPSSARPTDSQTPVNGTSGPTSDAQMAEALQRETNTPEAHARNWNSDAHTNGDTDLDRYGSDPQSAMSIGPKRKRNFSNRTKTGCLTCRRRKKKCDETHPVCLNCTKGGFTCHGYSVTRGLWPTKPAAVKPPVRLESKADGHSDVSEPPAYKLDRSGDGSPNSSRAHPPPPPAAATQYEGGQRRSFPRNEHDNHHQQPPPPQQQQPPPPPPQHYAPSPAHNDTRNRAPYPGPPQPQSQPQPQPQQWPPQQSQPSYTPDHLPPLSELNRPEPSSKPPSRDMSRPPNQGPLHPQPPPSSHQPPPPPPNKTSPINHQPPGPPPAPYSTHPHPPPGPPPQHYAYGPPPPPPADPRHQYHHHPPEHHTPPTHMRMASSSYDSHKSTARTFNKEDVERSKMLRHTAYNHFDPTLEDDRKRCQQALKRYNQAAELDSGVSADEQRNILLKVFDPSKDTTHRFLAAPQEKGTLSHGVRIEAPFKCTYGYNIKIMDSVYIGSGCKIDDAGRIDIGARTWIGPGVTIVTTGVSEEMIDRKGSGGSWKASPVTIASEVVIGEGAKICPGVIIGKGATVEPFALVKENLAEYERQCADQGPRKR